MDKFRDMEQRAIAREMQLQSAEIRAIHETVAVMAQACKGLIKPSQLGRYEKHLQGVQERHQAAVNEIVTRVPEIIPTDESEKSTCDYCDKRTEFMGATPITHTIVRACYDHLQKAEEQITSLTKKELENGQG